MKTKNFSFDKKDQDIFAEKKEISKSVGRPPIPEDERLSVTRKILFSPKEAENLKAYFDKNKVENNYSSFSNFLRLMTLKGLRE